MPAPTFAAPSTYPGMGAVLQNDGCSYRVWAPNANGVSLGGDFFHSGNTEAINWQEVPMSRDAVSGDGAAYWSVFVPGALADSLYAVQTLAGVLLPSATVFLLLLCNDKAILGPWANSRKTTIFTCVVMAILVILSVILTASVLFPAISGTHILAILLGGSLLALVMSLSARFIDTRQGRRDQDSVSFTTADRLTWRMPPLHQLPPARLTELDRTWLIVLRGYLVIAAGLVLVRIVLLVTPGH